MVEPESAAAPVAAPVEYQTEPGRYRHWQVAYDGPLATVTMAVDPEGGLRPGYELKLNSYDLGVDIELNDLVWRLRFEHPEVRVVMLRSGNDRAFCAGANITMLGSSSHAWKVNFCKFTNETRCTIEEGGARAGQRWIACCNGTTAGGGYELALACDEIVLIDDGNSAVSLPEVPLLGVLPGTGGLTRLVDKRKVRRDRADVFSTTAEGIRGKRAVEWGLVDAVIPRSKFDAETRARAQALAAATAAPGEGARLGVTLEPLAITRGEHERRYSAVRLRWDPRARVAQLELEGPSAAELELARQGGEALREAGCGIWALRAFRELEDAVLYLRTNLLDVGLVLIRATGDLQRTIAYDEALAGARGHWFVDQVLAFMANALRRLDLTSRSMFAIADAGTAFGGCLLELALAADRTYLLDDDERPVRLGLSPLNEGALPMSHGQSRLANWFAGREPELAAILAAEDRRALGPARADELGLVTVRLDALDWDDDLRIAIEERASLSPDALTGMEANLRFCGAETPTSKIFARLTAWQNWIFIRPNATGPAGALTLYGRPEKPSFDYGRV